MRVAILRRAPKASVSMDVYADRLVQGLKTVRPNWIITEYYPQFPSRSFAPSKMLAGIQKYYERYWRYPNRLKRVDADIFHIFDHTAGDLLPLPWFPMPLIKGFTDYLLKLFKLCAIATA